RCPSGSSPSRRRCRQRGWCRPAWRGYGWSGCRWVRSWQDPWSGALHGPAAHRFFPMPAAEGDIDGLLDGNLLALGEDPAGTVLTNHHRRLGAALADGANFAQRVGDGKQFARAGKELALEVGAQAEAHHRHVEPISDAGELPDLFGGEELRFIDKDAIHLGDIDVLAEGNIDAS